MTAPDSFVEQCMADAKEACAASYNAGMDAASDDYMRHLDGEEREKERDESLEALRANLTRQAARCKELEEDAARYRTLMELPGARRRVWNHVIDPHLTEGHNDIESVLDAARSVLSQKEQG